MAKRITAFAAADGTLFTDPAACSLYEKTTLLAVGVAAALAALGYTGSLVVKADDKDGETAVDLQEFLIGNSELLVEALSAVVQKAPRKSPTPRAPKEPTADPVTPSPELKQALEVLGASDAVAGDNLAAAGAKEIPLIKIAEEAVAAPVIEPGVTDAAAGTTAEAELEALLGGGGGEVAL